MARSIKILSKSISFLNEEFSFSNEVKMKVSNQFDIFFIKGLEVGGYFFSVEEIDNKFHNVWVSKPSKKDIFTKKSYKLDLTLEKRNINKYCKEKRYKCIWHSHLNYSVEPSNTDIENVIKLMKDLNEDIFISLIFSVTKINVICFYKTKKDKFKYKNKIIRRDKLWTI